MGRFLGELGTDVYNITAPEYKPCVLDYTVVEAAALDANGLLSEAETSATLVTTVTTFLAQPPTPRLVTAIVKAADAGEVTADSTITIYGTNIADRPISDVLTFTANQSTAKTTTKAFKTVTSVVFSAQADGTPAFDVGWDDSIGLPFMMSRKPFVFEMFNDAIQTTYGTITVDADEVEKNFYNPNGTLDGGKTLRLLMFM